MRVLIIGNSETTTNSDDYFGRYAAFFREAAAGAGEQVDVQYTLFDDLYIAVGDGAFDVYDTRNDCELREYQVIFLRGAGFRQYYDVIKTISVYAQRHGVQSVNDYSSFRDSSKLTQAVQFYAQDMPIAQTVYVTEAVLAGKRALTFDFPCILKATFGSHGNDNYLVNSMEEVRDIVARSKPKKFVLQRFVPNERDYRILIIGDEMAVIERTAAGDSHLNNTSQGASANLVPIDTLPPEIIAASRKIAQALQLSTAGVDALADKNTGKFYFLEVNAQPQLMTGAFLDVKSQMIGRFLQASLKKHSV